MDLKLYAQALDIFGEMEHLFKLICSIVNLEIMKHTINYKILPFRLQIVAYC